MKRLIVAAALLLSASAYADHQTLVHCESRFSDPEDQATCRMWKFDKEQEHLKEKSEARQRLIDQINRMADFEEEKGECYDVAREYGQSITSRCEMLIGF